MGQPPVGIQSIIFSGHKNLPCSTMLGFQINDVDDARAALNQIVDQFMTRDIPSPSRTHAVHIAISSEGLKSLAGDDTIDGLSREFQQGMTIEHRQYILGDYDKNDPKHWDWSDRDSHILILIYGKDQTHTDELEKEIGDLLSNSSGTTARLSMYADTHEPFGFLDGITNPRIDWLNKDQQTDPNSIPAGEVVLGLRDVTGAIQKPSSIGKHGTYLVLRQLEQDVKAFWQYWRSQAQDDEEATWLASKAVGRWPNGMPITGSKPESQPDYDKHVVHAPLTFRDDVFGDDCPAGAHIRRAHPRDGLPEGPEESLIVSRLHRLLRRGRVYGSPPLAEWFPTSVQRESHAHESTDDDKQRGLLFGALCADIARQFEFVQQTWLNDPKFVQPVSEVDPISPGVITNEQANAFTIPRLPLRRRCQQLPNFVTVRGGGYFLLPTVSALESMLS